jgi:hypothetical protein
MVGGLVVDDVTARLPERLAGPDHPLALTLELEEHLAVQHVAEQQSGVPVRRRAGVVGRQFDGRDHDFCW